MYKSKIKSFFLSFCLTLIHFFLNFDNYPYYFWLLFFIYISFTLYFFKKIFKLSIIFLLKKQKIRNKLFVMKKIKFYDFSLFFFLFFFILLSDNSNSNNYIYDITKFSLITFTLFIILNIFFNFKNKNTIKAAFISFIPYFFIFSLYNFFNLFFLFSNKFSLKHKETYFLSLIIYLFIIQIIIYFALFIKKKNYYKFIIKMIFVNISFLFFLYLYFNPFHIFKIISPFSKIIKFNWNIQFYVIYDEKNNYIGSGYKFFDYSKFSIKNHKFNTYNFPFITNIFYKLKKADMYLETTEKNYVQYIWDKKEEKYNNFLNSFSGIDNIKKSSFIYKRQKYNIIYLDEKLSGNLSLINKLWEKECFVVCGNDEIVLLGIKYDNFINGQILYKNNLFKITDIIFEENNNQIIYYTNSKLVFKLIYIEKEIFNIYSTKKFPKQFMFTGNLEIQSNDKLLYNNKINGVIEKNAKYEKFSPKLSK